MTRKKTESSEPHGKVTKPLSKSKTKKTSKKTKSVANGTAEAANTTKKRKWLFRRKQKPEQVYTSVKNRRRTFFNKATGASARGSVENDLYRFRWVWAIAFICLFGLIARAYYLQISNAQMYQEIGNKLITGERRLPSYRGIITDRNQLPLAVSAPLVTLTFSPYDYAVEYYSLKREIVLNPDQPKLQARMQARLDKMDLTRLAATAGVSLEDLQKSVHINDSVDVTDEKAVEAVLPIGVGSHYFPLMTKVTPEIADAVEALDFPAVYSKNFFQRYYPQPQPNAQLLGFMGQNSSDAKAGYIGRAGIEYQYNEELAGKDGKVLVLKDARQNSLKEIKELEPEVAGKDITLTIDSRLQYLLYKELEKVGRLQSARWATGMVVDVQSGEVLALSTWPSFNSNNLGEMTGENQRNRALIDVFEPGSVMKPFTVAAALDSGKYNKNSSIDTSPGAIRVNGYTIRDHGNLGVINLTTLLQKSSNVASTKIALSLLSLIHI